MYNTDKTRDIDNLQVNCLYYNNRITLKITERTEYCLDSTDSKYSSSDNFLNTRDPNFTFDELRQLNVSAYDLLSWSATIDLAEKYQYYLHHKDNSSASEEIFFNCTKPWFGPQCQYSFLLSTTYAFQSIVLKILKRKFHQDFPYNVIPSTCYMHLKCDRGGSGQCLDWREVCDGRIDCLDGGADETQCFDLELNECDENEYRCHNGLCIPKEFLKDEKLQCLDQTDIADIFYLPDPNMYPYIFDYEEHSCRPGYKQFPCGDGQCVADFNTCKNKRHLFLTESISNQGNLSYQCWMIMICLTKILDQVNGTTCNQLLRSSNISIYLQTCSILIQFPTIPVLFGHVHFLYHLNDTHHIDVNRSLIPTYVCYNQQLCDFLPPTFRNGNYSCRYAHEFCLGPSRNLRTWASVIGLIEPYFRKCSTGWNQQNYSDHPSLYCCKNSSKCISKHRILDTISDCYLNDDEEQFELSCMIPDTQRFKCGNEKKCHSILFSREICSPLHLCNLDEIEFGEICDRIVQVLPVIIDGKNHTDETECANWPCNNYYTRCDGFWSCPDGSDEENCTTPRICPSHTLPCVSPYNYTFTCLSANQVGNGRIDCLGAADEREHCRRYISAKTRDDGFRCWNDDKCLAVNDLCDAYSHCPLGDDETFCNGHNKICEHSYDFNLTIVEEALCRFRFWEKISFSLKNSLVYPPLESRTIEHMAQRTIEQHSVTNFVASEPNDSAWPWLCNHGLYVCHWLGNNNFNYKCFCPPNYYGDICQYQNQRVSFTAQVRIMNSRGIHTILVTLIDDDGDREEINSYQQFTSVAAVSCERYYNAYLTYSTRPKNSSKNYSVRVDVFDRNYLTNVSSWHFSIPFPFLPVNRMAVILDVPVDRVPSPSHCQLTCHHGECMKYMNKDKFFCRCHSGWSGVRCHIPVRCSDCSLDSICAGVIHNRSICICPLHKGGPRCLLKFTCPKDFCDNNAECLVLDDGMNEYSYACSCREPYYGIFCNLLKSKLEISFHDIEVSSHLLAYVVYMEDDLSLRKKLTIKVMPQKLTMFQRTVTLYFRYGLSLVFIKMDQSYYLAVLQHDRKDNISTSVSPNQRCKSITELLNFRMLAFPEIRRVKQYHILCQTRLNLMCFFDEYYMCLCTLDRHANCFKFDHTPIKCQLNNHCQNEGTCLQFDPVCQFETTCICTDCFYGDRCQYYAKGIGLTLDDILRYAIRPNTTVDDQSSIVKWSSALTIIMFVATFINSVLSMITFATKESRAVGCGLYLLASSITSLLTMSIFILKFWFLILTQIHTSVSNSVLQKGCVSIEFILKVCLYTDNWLNACVALERSITVYKEVNFKKMLSKRIARWIIIILPLIIAVSIIHEPINRDIFEDKDEKRFWCVFHYSPSIHIYNTIILIFHTVGPFCINLFSSLFIILRGTRRRAVVQRRQTFRQHLRKQFKGHKNLIIGPIILVVLVLPRLMISFLSGCVKVSHNAWLYLLGYFVSFIPSMSIFFVFVLPSKFYRKQFKESIQFIRRRIC
jgi:hypothetical protein